MFGIFFNSFFKPYFNQLSYANLKSDYLESSTSLINKPHNVESFAAQTVQNELCT